MRIAIIGTNGMLSVALTKAFMRDGHIVDAYGLHTPNGYECSRYYPIDLLKESIDYCELSLADVIIYASGAGVQSVLNENAELMYALNVNVPINITLNLKHINYTGIFVTFGSYMEIGCNQDNGRKFSEKEIIFSSLPATSDYVLSKRVFSRYISGFDSKYTTLHFFLPNLYSYEDKLGGTRLTAYVLNYLKAIRSGDIIDEPRFSAGTQTRQFVLLEEIPSVIAASILRQIPSGCYNIGGGEFMSVRQCIELLFRLYNVECRDEYFSQDVKRDNDIKSLRMDASKLQDLLGNLPHHTMAESLS